MVFCFSLVLSGLWVCLDWVGQTGSRVVVVPLNADPFADEIPGVDVLVDHRDVAVQSQARVETVLQNSEIGRKMRLLMLI